MQKLSDENNCRILNKRQIIVLTDSIYIRSAMQAFDEICAHGFLNIDIDTIQQRRQEYPHGLKFFEKLIHQQWIRTS